MDLTPPETCPQCNKEVNISSNRLVQDACGHRKCRACLLQDDVGCKMCQEIKKSEISVIKYDGNHKISEVFTENDNRDPNEEVKIETECKDDKKKLKRQYKPLVIPPHVAIITKSPLLYRCTICSKSFHSTTNIKYHLYCNGQERPLKCNECEKSFITKSSLETHLRSHSGIRPYICKVCSKSFIQKSKLNRHMKIHTGDSQYVCFECGKKCNTKDALVIHFRQHTSEKPFKCNHCDSAFTNKSNLNKHLAVHAKEKAFMCDQCGKKFKGKMALFVHKKIHSEKKFNCTQCPKSFFNNQDLKRHHLTHQDAKTFCCTICSTKFRRKDNLDRHVKNTHSGNDSEKTKSEKTENKRKPETNEDNFQEKPNAINVIKSSETLKEKSKKQNHVPVINGPFKLAFKTDTFKNNYNIHNRDYVDTTPHIKTITKEYKMEDLVAILKEEKLPAQPKNVITSVGMVNEKDSLEICKKIFSGEKGDEKPLHYETSFENKEHASIKNIKFKLPSTYTNASQTTKNDKNGENGKENTFNHDNFTNISKSAPKEKEFYNSNPENNTYSSSLGIETIISNEETRSHNFESNTGPVRTDSVDYYNTQKRILDVENTDFTQKYATNFEPKTVEVYEKNSYSQNFNKSTFVPNSNLEENFYESRLLEKNVYVPNYLEKDYQIKPLENFECSKNVLNYSDTYKDISSDDSYNSYSKNYVTPQYTELQPVRIDEHKSVIVNYDEISDRNFNEVHWKKNTAFNKSS